MVRSIVAYGSLDFGICIPRTAVLPLQCTHTPADVAQRVLPACTLSQGKMASSARRGARPTPWGFGSVTGARPKPLGLGTVTEGGSGYEG